jgi:Ras-related protein Rab-21
MLGTDIVLTIAGNKCDLERNRVVSQEKAEAYANSVGAKHFNTSAKLNKGVDELFLDLTKRMLELNPKINTTKNKGFKWEEETQSQQSSSCC